jgi:hypothetical protein
VSVDPVGDMPANAREFLQRRDLDPRVFRFLLGTRAQLRPVWRAYGIVPIGATPGSPSSSSRPIRSLTTCGCCATSAD